MTLPFYLIVYRENFENKIGWFLISMGFLVGCLLFVISVKVGIRVFTQLLGFITGIFLCNSLEISILFRAEYSYYFEYILLASVLSILAQVFNVNIYNHMTSWIGSFLVVRGINTLVFNDQLAEVKQFIAAKGFEKDPITGDNIIDIWRPVFITALILIIGGISQWAKTISIRRQFKTEQHPYYQI